MEIPIFLGSEALPSKGQVEDSPAGPLAFMTMMHASCMQASTHRFDLLTADDEPSTNNDAGCRMRVEEPIGSKDLETDPEAA